jgi:hypothetical protein
VSDNPSYSEHAIFTDLACYQSLYQALGSNAFDWASYKSVSKHHSFDTNDWPRFYIMSFTFDSLHLVLQAGRINDAYALSRKYADLIVICLYIIFNSVNPTDQFKDAFKTWLNNPKPLENPWKLSILSTEDYVVGQASEQVKQIINLRKDTEDAMKLCNAHIHLIDYSYGIFNLDGKRFDQWTDLLDELQEHLRSLVLAHTAYLFSLRANYLLKLAVRRIDETVIDPIVIGYIDTILKPNKPELADYLSALANRSRTELLG